MSWRFRQLEGTVPAGLLCTADPKCRLHRQTACTADSRPAAVGSPGFSLNQVAGHRHTQIGLKEHHCPSRKALRRLQCDSSGAERMFMSGGSAVQKLWDAWSATNVGPGNLLAFIMAYMQPCCKSFLERAFFKRELARSMMRIAEPVGSLGRRPLARVYGAAS